MKFHLNFNPNKADIPIKHHHKLICIGSCFTENIGNWLADLKYQCLINPNGIIFNPASICQSINHALDSNAIQEETFLLREHQYFSYLHHSKIKAASAEELKSTIAQTNTQMKDRLSDADFLFITLGSAYAYHHKKLGIIVANCHKQNQAEFEKKLLTVNEIVQGFKNCIEAIQKLNPKIKCIFTVSPVKHLKDGIIENNRSKATLLLAVHQLTEALNQCDYFPAYELVNDDLRDYRFYKSDLAHPNQQAIAYIQEKFADCYFDEPTKKLIHEITKLINYLNHKNLHGQAMADENQDSYIQQQKALIKQLYPEIQF